MRQCGLTLRFITIAQEPEPTSTLAPSVLRVKPQSDFMGALGWPVMQGHYEHNRRAERKKTGCTRVNHTARPGRVHLKTSTRPGRAGCTSKLAPGPGPGTPGAVIETPGCSHGPARFVPLVVGTRAATPAALWAAGDECTCAACALLAIFISVLLAM